MAKQFQFDEFDDPGSDRGKTKAPHCIACEEMLADALDGTLDQADQAWFDGHVSTCANCGEMLGDAQRGAAWLEMLKMPRPEPSARLVERILAETSGGMPAGETRHQPQMVPAAAPLAMPAAMPGNLLQFRAPARRPAPLASGVRSRWMFEPRLAMTAAMAFFSIALTLNLTGVQLNRLHVSALKPSNLKRTYYTANAEATRYYDNLRVVRVMESRVEDLREAATDRAQIHNEQPKARPEAPAKKPEEKKKPLVEPGVSRQAPPTSRPDLVKTREEIYRIEEPVAGLPKIHRAGGLA